MLDNDEESTTEIPIKDKKLNGIKIINPKKPKRSGRDIIEIVKEKFDKLMRK